MTKREQAARRGLGERLAARAGVVVIDLVVLRAIDVAVRAFSASGAERDRLMRLAWGMVSRVATE